MSIGKDPRESRCPARGCLGPLNARLRLDCLVDGWGTLKVLGAVVPLKHHCLEETILALMFKKGKDRKSTRQGISVTVG